MSEAIAISTSKYITTVKAKIDDRVYTVRKIGAGEQLDLSREIGKIGEYQVEALNLRGKYETATDEESKSKLLAEILKISEAIGEINDRIEAIYIGLFDDGENGSYSKRLVHSLGIENVQKVYDEIMGVIDEKSA
ncbi:MAG: hypothetical protein J6X18_10670 [Bacteroidales bacterium]|nr:hypothetical protein [Bacteroidales bacterium]